MKSKIKHSYHKIFAQKLPEFIDSLKEDETVVTMDYSDKCPIDGWRHFYHVITKKVISE